MWKNLDPVRSEHGLTILPMATLESSAPLDLILVPGGAGSICCSRTPRFSLFCAMPAPRRAMSSGCAPARWCSAPPDCCVGAARLPTGCRATCCARSAPRVAQRVVVDGKFFTGGGVTAGIDVALTVAAAIAGRARGGSDPARHRIRPGSRRLRRGRRTGRPGGPEAVLARAEPRQRDRAQRVARAASAL